MDLSRYQSVVSRLRGLKPKGRYYSAHCPAHDDQQASLTVRVGPTGDLLLKCHKGNGCKFREIVDSLGVTERDCMAEPTGNGKRIVAEYDYTDEGGTRLYQVVRFEPKGFAQRRPGTNGSEWVWNLGPDVRRVLYRLPELATNRARANPRMVWVVEGEKDVHRLESLGLLATTNAGGAEKWRAEYGESLSGCHVVIVPDNDEPGAKHAAQVSEMLKGHAASVKILSLAGLGPKEDVSDWLEKHTKDDLTKLVKATPYAWCAKKAARVTTPEPTLPPHQSLAVDLEELSKSLSPAEWCCRATVELRRFQETIAGGKI